MTDREKLIQLFKEVEYTPFPDMTMKSNLANQFTDYALNCIADYLISNGITFNRIGQWKTHISDDGYVHHFCSECGTDAIFEVLYVPDYDEDLDGEWRYCGDRECGIAESLTQCCPHCGVKMRGVEE